MIDFVRWNEHYCITDSSQTCKYLLFIHCWILLNSNRGGGGNWFKIMRKIKETNLFTKLIGLIHVNLKPIPSQAKKSMGLGGHLSHYVFCAEGCLRIQKNIGLRPIKRRNTASKRFWWKWPFIWVFYIENTGKCHFFAYICYFEHLKMVFMKFW